MKKNHILRFVFLFEDCPGGIGAEDMLKAMGEPERIVIETDFSIKAIQTTIESNNVKVDTMVQLAQANRTKIEWPRVTFLQVVGAIHNTSKKYTMLQAEHMAGLVGQDSAAPAEEKRAVIRSPRFAIKLRVVTRKAIHADALPRRSLTEDEIPGRRRVEVLHSDG